MSTRATLALDELHAQITPEQAASIRAHLPTALRDQFTAATADAATVVDLAGQTIGADLIHGYRYASVPEWIRLPLIDTIRALTDGSARTCRHSPDPRRPGLMFASAWVPGLVTCPACLHLHRRRGEADRTCDCCGQVTDPQVAGIRQCTMHYGPLVYSFGTCRNCHPDLESIR